ncbi:MULTISPECIES: L-lysine 6-transaminase [Streptomycetaceae]|uniref:L-lysine-epsilon aminotransferase n=1 Tax=Streptantibioticus cattleyicolor (strain ATCC 35852 / DSM 46488 / JCM 4925 / NBRC 14057 / NRRL 8057) TaxID=1003195 RepID=F8JTW6_STREN|nr:MULTISPECIES: L-lysine 6-transaminase [Streptomycetaceae]AEW98056.1 L-lysine-epsilon aminotransferase [Streptantibioticus cattleyicolor NRRL 8057 = DSM 46488]MYS62450.1 L-lysine 6-transaminase [Streptomyces sp. SID5468]CCB78372.1 L-lysine-epsilon aminotransferase [Streptantibioticus cattleyicolor NRRL 8057 = DSM 46488]
MGDDVRCPDHSAPETADLTARDVHRALEPHVLVDGYDLVVDLSASSGAWLVDAVTGKRYLDLFSFFASAPLGINPSCLTDDPEFLQELAAVAVNKPSNPDLYSVPYARFVRTFARVLGDPRLPHLFFVDGGALAVENALKAAFDWKAQRLGLDERAVDGLKVLHLERSFHGRSGYTMSLTNTEPAKTVRYPKFAWPRIPCPALRHPLAEHAAANREAERRALAAAEREFRAADGMIACFIAEPIQGEGGDNHLSAGFLQGMQRLCHAYDALFVLDEVQSGCGITGTAWAYQQLDLRPDLVAFGKKTQVCGVMGGGRIDEVPRNVFTVSSRISSTWGGNLTDMVRATRILETIERTQLLETVVRRGKYFRDGLEALAGAYPGTVTNARGSGLMCAVDLPGTRSRDEVLRRMYREHQVIALPCGERGLRFRPALTIGESEIDQALDALARSVEPLAA